MEDATASAVEAGGCDRVAARGHRLVALRQFNDARGSLAVIEYGKEIGFLVERAYFMYGPGANSDRGAHAHRDLEQLIVALQGSVDITLDNGRKQCRHRLDQPTHGLYLGPMVWRKMSNFSANSVCFVLASRRYDSADYVRDYERFTQALRG
jgi:hypothetical protein